MRSPFNCMPEFTLKLEFDVTPDGADIIQKAMDCYYNNDCSKDVREMVDGLTPRERTSFLLVSICEDYEEDY